jgi:glutamate racemase
MSASQPIGIFDSGMGGLTLVQALLKVLPGESVLYYGDTAHLPYGRKTQQEIQVYSLAITRYLLERGAKAIVVACNTATAAAINLLRETWPDVPILGMEPAVKPAARGTKSGVVAVLATQGTFQSSRYAELMHKYGKEIEMLENPCHGLVELIESGKANAPETEALLREVLQPMLAAGADAFVLGCTHYPFVVSTIRKIVGPEPHLINPAPAVALHLAQILEEKGLQNPATQPPTYRFYASGPAGAMQGALRDYLGLDVEVERLVL